jgi:crotonobetainyl-CoA:carnitine CoA-transferase CaiB-like acyl-CoA transferase
MLEGIRIVDLTSVVFGPYATQMLADMGAEVIRVEPPTGDPMRKAGRSPKARGMAPPHVLLNRGKRSIALDLKQPDDARTMRALIATADVFVHNIREAAIARLGFGWDEVRAIRSDIIYAHCVGFGSEGPYAGLQAYDDVIQAASGTATLLPRADGDPRPRYLPSLIADKVAGLYGAQAILAAIVHKLRTGEGQHVEVPMFESFTHFMLLEHLFGQVYDPSIEPVGYPRQLQRHRQPFPTADGYISIVPYTSDAFVRVFDVLGNPAILADERYNTPKLQTINIEGLYEEMARLTPRKTTAEWLALFADAQVPAMAVRDIGDMLDDPHLRNVGFFERHDDADIGGHYVMRLPTKFGAGVRPNLVSARVLDADGAAIRASLSD